MARKKPASIANKIANALAKKFGKDRAIVLSKEMQAISQVREFIPTGIGVLDHYLLGRGGLPLGRMSEWFGPNNIGKTHLMWTALASAQRAGATTVLIDQEQAFDEARAVHLGIDPEALIVIQPETLDEMLDITKELLEKYDIGDGPLFMGWDSIASAVTAQSKTYKAGKRKVGDVPQMLSEELKKITAMLTRRRAHLMALNQVRANIGVMYGDNTTTPGGNAPKFYSSQRVQLLGGKAVKNSKEEHIAKIITAIIVKNRLGPPFRKAKVMLNYERGFDDIWTTTFHAKAQKLIKPRKGKGGGNAGKANEGVAAYNDAIRRLGWPRTPLAGAAGGGVTVTVDDGEEEERDEDDESEDE